MKIIYSYILTIGLFLGCSKTNFVGILPCDYPYPNSNATHPKHEQFQGFLNTHLVKGYPGLALAVLDSANGFWVDAVGFASIEAQTPMEKCHLHHSASVCKMYIATTILKLTEQGKIDLDDKAIQYLPSDLPEIANLQEASVKQLLNHSSGIYDFDSNPLFYVDVINETYVNKTVYDYLNKYVKGKKSAFAPGEHHGYSDTNYLLLGLMIEAVSEQALGEAVQSLILTPAGLFETYYKASEGYPNVPGVTENYATVYDNSIENGTAIQQHSANISTGHEGMLASPRDYVLFLSKLLNGEILNAATLELMLDFQENSRGNLFGLGIFKFQTDDGTLIGHSGGGYGTMTYLLHSIDKNTTYFYGSNLGSVFENPMGDNFGSEMFDDILKIVNE